MAKKVQHGGKRPGAGRKPTNPEGPTIPLVATVPGKLVEQLDSMAAKNGWNRSEAVTRAIRGLLAAPKRSDNGR
jgi:hypothetical protein